MKYHFKVLDTKGAIVFGSQVPDQGSDTPKQALTLITNEIKNRPRTRAKLTYVIYGVDVAKQITLSMEGQDFMFLEERSLEDTWSFHINGVKQDRGMSYEQVEAALAKLDVTTYHQSIWQEVPVKVKPITTTNPATLALAKYRRREKFTGAMRITANPKPRTIN